MNDIKSNLENVFSAMKSAAIKAGRSEDSCQLIAVSKTRPIEDLKEAYALGIRDFGENKVQEIMDKIDLLPPDARFHMIGHLQKNKVKYIVGRVYLIHSVDSYELARVIEAESCKKNVITDTLIEVNVSGEASKYGVRPEELTDLVRKVSLLPHVRIKGLMTVAPYVDDAEQNRQYFVEMRKLSIDIKNQNIDNVSVDILSMGMTADYGVAIEEGATYVRVGTGIFGARDYS